MRIVRWTLMALTFATFTAVSVADPLPKADPPPKKADPPAATEAARVEAVVVVAGKSVTLQSKSGLVRSVVNSKNNIARVNPDRANPNRVMIHGLKAGVSRLTITDVNGGIEKLIIAVEAADEVAPQAVP